MDGWMDEGERELRKVSWDAACVGGWVGGGVDEVDR